MKIKDVVSALERFAPLPLQESYDNAGLQIGLTDAEVSGVLLCLDVTEEVVKEAVDLGCNLIVSHHPLLFRGVKRISDATMVERCVWTAIRNGVAIYSAHTNLDNVSGGVNHKIAEKLGLVKTDFLRPQGEGGSGLVGFLKEEESPHDFLLGVKEKFGIKCLLHNSGPLRPVRKVALCGGAGDFLLEDAVSAGADVFLTGEMHYHQFFGLENSLWIGVMGHYQSEKFTIELLQEYLCGEFPEMKLMGTSINTNPIFYL